MIFSFCDVLLLAVLVALLPFRRHPPATSFVEDFVFVLFGGFYQTAKLRR